MDKSKVAKQCIPGAEKLRCVLAYHEIVKAPDNANKEDFDGNRCDVWYQGRLSPDFYAWVFPHGNHCSIGVGSEKKDFSAPDAVRQLRQDVKLDDAETVRCEGAPIPLKPLKRWDDGRNVLLAGDACGVVAPASGEGIYYAMLGGRLAAEAVGCFLETGDAKTLLNARKQFMKLHGRVFWILGLLQRFWYSTDAKREKFVSMCRDPDVQFLTWQAYTRRWCAPALRMFESSQGCGTAVRACSPSLWTALCTPADYRFHAAVTCGGIFFLLQSTQICTSFLPFFCAGAALILALRVVILQGAWQYVAVFLILALIAHLIELYRRLKDREELLQR